MIPSQPSAVFWSLIAATGIFAAAPAAAQDATNAAAIADANGACLPHVAPHPTVRFIAIEWPISGDDDGDGVVTVRYRVQGVTAWTPGIALRRVPSGSNVGFDWSNRHAGSLFDLQPGTVYEIELSLSDPDGGDTVLTCRASTRPIPNAASNATVVAVTPGTFAAAAGNAQPGEILLLADGNYAGFTFERDGTADAPIVIRAENPQGAIIDGDIYLSGRSDVFVEALRVNGKIKFNNATRIVVRRCHIYATTAGIISYDDGVEDAYICDNRVIGHATWSLDQLGAGGFNDGEGIEITGPGNVICHNYVSGFRDAISTMEGSLAKRQYSIDIVGNDIDVATDDAIEADFTMGNVRVLRNRIHNAFIGLSGQPTLGGPLYFMRNAMYNVFHVPFKLYRGSVGDIAWHNTVVKYGDGFGLYPGVTWSRAHFRNNIFIAGYSGTTYAATNGGYSTGDGDVADISDAQLTGPDACSFDYDGYGAIGVGFAGKINGVTFDSLAAMRANTSEAHAQQLDLGIFAQSVALPDPPVPSHPTVDLRLTAGNDAIDTGEVIDGFNETHTGAAPDLGAYELGQALPIYGPRPAAGGSNGAGGTGSGGTGAGGTGGSGAGGSGTAGSGGTTSGTGGTGTAGTVGSGGDTVPGIGGQPGGCRGSPLPGSALLFFGAALMIWRRRGRFH